MTRIASIAAAALAALGAISSAAQAAPVDVTKLESWTFGSADLQRIVTYRFDGEKKRTYAGRFELTGSDGFGDFYAWCVDIAETLSLPATYDIEPAPFSSATLGNVDRLFTGYYGDVDTKDEAAGFQMALWEIVYDTDTGIDDEAGRFRFWKSGGAYDVARGYLSGFASAGTGAYDLTFLDADGTQDLVTASPAPIPLPAAFWMLGAGVAGLGLMRRRAR